MVQEGQIGGNSRIQGRHVENFSRGNPLHRRFQLRPHQLDIRQPVARRMDHDDPERETAEILLVFEVCVDRNKNVKVAGNACKQLTVLEPGETRLWNGLSLRPWKQSLQLPRQALVDNHPPRLHAATGFSMACSASVKTACTCSKVTVGVTPSRGV